MGAVWTYAVPMGGVEVNEESSKLWGGKWKWGARGGGFGSKEQGIWEQGAGEALGPACCQCRSRSRLWASHACHPLQLHAFGWGTPSTEHPLQLHAFGWGTPSTEHPLQLHAFGWGTPSTEHPALPLL
eukprot:366284-Chlamydomonas_euryale.AAC.4